MEKKAQDQELVNRISEKYSEDLKFLWEQYNRLLGIGLFSSATTLAFLLQAILFSKDLRELIQKKSLTLDTNWLAFSIFLAGAASLLFIIARWCSQLLMERQVLGRHEDAAFYFESILGNQVIWPTALRQKPYLKFIPQTALMRFIGGANEVCGWLAVSAVLLSWLCGFIFAWPLMGTL
jgi:hypothetical protein